MCSNKDWFSTYEIVTMGSMVMRNNLSCKIVGINKIKIKIFDGKVMILGEVRHILTLNKNIIFFSALIQKSTGTPMELEF